MKPSNPEYQVGLNFSYDTPFGLGFTFSANYNSDVCAARLCVVKMPEVTILNAGLRKTVRQLGHQARRHQSHQRARLPAAPVQRLCRAS